MPAAPHRSPSQRPVRSAGPSRACRGRAGRAPRQRWELAPLPSEIRRARTLVQSFADAAALPQETVAAAVLATSEAVTNAVMHAFRDGAGDEDRVELSVGREEDELVVVVSDNGSGMRPGLPSAGAGIGLMLIADLAAAFSIERPAAGSGTVLTMRFADAA